jgi:hypothetical protein
MNVFHGFARRAVMLSSGDVYRAAGILHGTEPGEPDNAPITEDAPLRTQPHAYPPEAIQMLQKLFAWAEPDYDKIPAERIVMGNAELPGTVLRHRCSTDPVIRCIAFGLLSNASRMVGP